MVQNKKVISIVITALMSAILAFVSIHSLWITVPLLLCMTTNLDGGAADILFSLAFGIALDVFAFCNSIWFGIIFLVLGFIALLLTRDDKDETVNAIYCNIIYIVLYNVGTVIFGGCGSVLLYAVPSLIVIFLLLLRNDGGFVEKMFLIKEEQKRLFEEKRKQQEIRKKYVNEDMERMEKMLGYDEYNTTISRIKYWVGIGEYDAIPFNIIPFDTFPFDALSFNTIPYVLDELSKNTSIPSKIATLQLFNKQLQGTINVYEEKANKIIEETYKSVMGSSLIPRNVYFRKFNRIAQQYASQLNPVLATACEASVNKVATFINQKQEIINKNDADIAKYQQLFNRIKRQYDD